MKTLLRLLLKTQHQRNRSGPAQTEKGMTLVELLVGAIMAFLIITPMLGFVVDMLNTDRREQVKSNTEQDVQAALDFIAQDLSQAIYIYDNNPAPASTPTTTATGIPALLAGNFIPAANATQTPILVFWKRQILPNSLPLVAGDQPDTCTTTPNGANTCNDTYVLALVAYYEVRDANPTWCQPSGAPCPTRIVRYQIQDGLRDPNLTDPALLNRYFAGVSDSQDRSDAFNPGFDISNPTQNVTFPGVGWDRIEVLVNYIDHSPGPALTGNECRTALGNPTDTSGVTPTPIPETTLIIANPTNSFYACVDTSKNIARVTLRGNSLRRLQPNDTAYNPNRSAFFPTASVQVQGLGARGR
ncbi:MULTISPECIES: hormogonium polysaccharide secretion pseudopilin HpsC [unclassified Microcoleus]|uniref:hormogonium polysaccharide secretion pseudopilin HpsC n=1 Tax=unclassified Microcoleus TaxID=2642155 RepID=UPI002FCF5B8E